MIRLLSWLVLLFAVFAAPSTGAAAKSQAQYDGADGGYLVYSVGTIRIGMQFTFPYRRIASADETPTADWKGEISPKMGGAWTMKAKNPDFQGFETGQIIVRRLLPGRYQIANFGFSGSGIGGVSYVWSSARPFALDFTVRAGRATYIGSFMRSPTPKEELRSTLGYAGYFLIADRSERDLPIARAKQPSLPDAIIEVTDVEAFGHPALRSHSLE